MMSQDNNSEQSHTAPVHQDNLSLNIQFTTGHTIKIPLYNIQTTVLELKHLILKSCHNAREPQLRKEAQEKPYLRLIFQGKLLQDPMYLSFYNISNGDFIHVIFSMTVSRQQGNVNSPQPASTIQQSEQDTLPPPPRGFDRLIEAGFNLQDVLLIRNQFYASRPNLLAQLQQGRITGEDLRELEEEWMNEDDPRAGLQHLENNNGNNGRQNDTQTYYEGNSFHMYAGILLGFFLGFVVLLLLLERIVPRRFKYGILAGIACNICFALIKFFMPEVL